MASTDGIIPRLRRTLTGIFQLAKNGVNLKNSGELLQIRNAADTAYSDVELDELKLVDPANVTRSVQLRAPTLPTGTGYALKLPTDRGSANNAMKSDGAGNTSWRPNTTGVYGAFLDGAYLGMYYASTADGDPEFIPRLARHNYYMGLSPNGPDEPGGIGSSVYWLLLGGQAAETLYDPTIAGFRDVYANPASLDFATDGNQNPFLPQDIYWHWDGTSHALVQTVVPWLGGGGFNNFKTITGVTNASPPVLTVGASHGFVVGDPVVIQDIDGTVGTALNDVLYRVSATAATTITLQTVEAVNVAAPGVYVSGGKAWKIDLTATKQLGESFENGILVTDISAYIGGTSPTWAKYMGTVCYGESKNQIYDTLDRPFVYNYYNQYERPIGTIPYNDTLINSTINSTTTPTNSRAALNSHGWSRQWYLIGRWHGGKMSLAWKTWIVTHATASTQGVYVSYLSKNAVANYDNAAPYNFSPEIRVKGWITGATSVTDLAPLEVEAQPHVYNAGSYIPSQPEFGYWQAMEFMALTAVNWTVHLNYFSVNQYRAKGGFKGSYPR